MDRKELVDNTYTNKYWRTGLHLLFWTLLFGSHYYFSTISFGTLKDTAAAYGLAAKNTILLALFYYALMYFIWPRCFAKKGWLRGTILLFSLFLLYAVLDAYADKYLLTRCVGCMAQLKINNPDYYHFLQRPIVHILMGRVLSGGLIYHLLIQLSLPLVIKTGRSYFRQTVQGLKLSKDNLQLEFNFLKAQVNPHFLFNTLNNIYSLVVNERKEQAAATIARLSGFMRYTLYETGEETILLDKEIGLLKDYVELEKLRLNETAVTFNYEKDRDDYRIPPLLFMPALENAFKYSVDNVASSHIKIDIAAFNNELEARIQNNFDPQEEVDRGGIGLQNLKKRLAHYYPGQSSYTATATNDVYLFRLSCTLHEKKIAALL